MEELRDTILETIKSPESDKRQYITACVFVAIMAILGGILYKQLNSNWTLTLAFTLATAAIISEFAWLVKKHSDRKDIEEDITKRLEVALRKYDIPNNRLATFLVIEAMEAKAKRTDWQYLIFYVGVLILMTYAGLSENPVYKKLTDGAAALFVAGLIAEVLYSLNKWKWDRSAKWLKKVANKFNEVSP